MFLDSSNPLLHRRLLLNWILYQRLATDNDKKRSYGQQLLMVITNIRGNTGQRFNAIRREISATLTRDCLVEQLLDVIDPVDR